MNFDNSELLRNWCLEALKCLRLFFIFLELSFLLYYGYKFKRFENVFGISLKVFGDDLLNFEFDDVVTEIYPVYWGWLLINSVQTIPFFITESDILLNVASYDSLNSRLKTSQLIYSVLNTVIWWIKKVQFHLNFYIPEHRQPDLPTFLGYVMCIVHVHAFLFVCSSCRHYARLIPRVSHISVCNVLT